MRKEITITSNQDNLKLSVLMYIPEKIKAIVQIAHGMCEHKERYEKLMKFLCDEGYLVVANDHRGHGDSVKSENDFGYFYDDTGEYLVEDLHQITNYLKDEYPNLPVYLIGHSMGSLAVRKYIKKYDADIDKLIVCGSPSQNNLTGFAIFLAKLSTLFTGKHHRNKLLNNISIGAYDKMFKNEPRNSWINSNMEEVRKYNNDPKCGFVFTNNGFFNLFSLLKDTYSKRGWEFKNPNLKILFIAGSKDPVIINESAWLNSMTFLREIGYDKIDYILYEGDRHEVFNEKNYQEVFEDVKKFLNE